MSDLRKAAEQMLECLLYHYNAGNSNTVTGVRLKLDEKAIREARAALAAPRPEPVAWGVRWKKTDEVVNATTNPQLAHEWRQQQVMEVLPLYTAPPAAAPDDVEALRRDAERYRWMTKDDTKYETRRRVRNILSLFNAYAYRKEHIDAAIDAAMDASTAPSAAAVDASKQPAMEPSMPCAYPHCCDKAGNRCPRMFAGLCSGPRAADPQQVGR